MNDAEAVGGTDLSRYELNGYHVQFGRKHLAVLGVLLTVIGLIVNLGAAIVLRSFDRGVAAQEARQLSTEVQRLNNVLPQISAHHSETNYQHLTREQSQAIARLPAEVSNLSVQVGVLADEMRQRKRPGR